MRVLSLFDGMSCGMIAMMAACIPVDRYDAYEIDKYAITASKHNFPQIEHHGDVFDADFTAYRGYDFLMGGSPCTYWSSAQQSVKKNTGPQGMGWELFSQYVRALYEARPRRFIYENNASMPDDVRQEITAAFGFEPIEIDSARVSAQSRKRLYWAGIRQPDGSYRAAHIAQPEDRMLAVKNILNGAEPTARENCRTHRPGRVGIKPRERDGAITDGQAFIIYSTDGKSPTLKANAGGAAGKAGFYATQEEPQEGQTVCKVSRGRGEINGARCPLRLPDGQYVIRTLTVSECKQLQTVPEWYDFSCVSEEQARKMLGNGWTCEVIAHLIRGAMKSSIFGI